MAEQTHNDTVMGANLPTLSEKCWKGGHRCEGVYAVTHVQLCRCVCRSQLKGQAWEGKPPPSVGSLLATH